MRSASRFALMAVILLAITGCGKHAAPVTPSCSVAPAADVPAHPFGLDWNRDFLVTINVRHAGEWNLSLFAGNDGLPAVVINQMSVTQGCDDVHTLLVTGPWQTSQYRYWWLQLSIDGKVVYVSPTGDRLLKVWY